VQPGARAGAAAAALAPRLNTVAAASRSASHAAATLRSPSAASRATARALAPRDLRQFEQKYPDFLARLSVKPATVKQYDTVLARFGGWLRRHGRAFNCREELDRCLASYFLWLFLAGELPWRGERLIAALVFNCPPLAGSQKVVFPRATRSLAGWRSECPGAQRPPIPWKIAAAIGYQMMQLGRVRWGAAVVIGFDAMLRFAELQRVRPEHVFEAEVGDGVASARTVVSLPRTKTGLRQATWVESPDARRILRFWSRRPASDGTVFGIEPHRFYELWHRCVASMGLGGLGLTPHSLRHGGATHMALSGRSAADIMLRGRWKSKGCFVRYTQPATLGEVTARISAKLHQAADEALRCLSALACDW
jgi:integrase